MNRPQRDDAETGWSAEATLRQALRHARRVVVAVVGGTLLVIGGVMVLAPGPATVVIPLGLAILAAEFAWARRLLRRVGDQFPGQLGEDRKQSEAAPEQDEPHGVGNDEQTVDPRR